MGLRGSQKGLGSELLEQQQHRPHLHFLFVVHACDGQDSLSNEEVVSRIGILTQKSHVVILRVEPTHELTKNVAIHQSKTATTKIMTTTTTTKQLQQ